MKKSIVVAAFAFMILSLSAVAGFLQPAPVVVEVNEDLSGNAQGDMVTARFADNDVELIGCGSILVSEGFAFGFCQAVDVNGVQVVCTTTDAALLQQMRSTGDYSFIRFEWNADGECTFFRFSTQSFYIPQHMDQQNRLNKRNNGAGPN